MAKTDYFPRRIGDQRNWLETYRTQIVTTGPILGMAVTEVTANTDAADAIIATIDATIAAENTYKQKVEDKNLSVSTNFNGIIRAAVKRLKTSTGYTEGLGAVLGVVGSDGSFDPDTFVPTVKAKVFPGEVKLTFVKGGADGVKIYVRNVSATTGLPMPAPGNPTGPETTPASSEDFEMIAIDLHSPYVDNRPLAVAGRPEVREYYVRGILHDQVIGQNSDFVRVTVSE